MNQTDLKTSRSRACRLLLAPLLLGLFAVLARPCPALAMLQPSPELSRAICEFQVLPPKEGFGVIEPWLKHLMMTNRDNMTPFFVDPSVVTGFNGSISNRGTFGGVFSVNTRQGQMVLKLYSGSSSLHEISYGLRLQWLLGLMGLAPRLTGIIQPKDVGSLLRNTPHLRQDPAYATRFTQIQKIPRFGILMEEINPHWHVKVPRDLQKIPPSLHGRIRTELIHLQRVLRALRIAPIDEQVMVRNGDGTVFVHDLDFYGWISSEGVVFDAIRSGRKDPSYVRIYGDRWPFQGLIEALSEDD